MWHHFAVSNQANEVVQNNRVHIIRQSPFGAFVREPQETFREKKASAESCNEYRQENVVCPKIKITLLENFR